MNITFKCSTQPSFTNSIIVERTYAGLMAGMPNEKRNKLFIEDFLVKVGNDAHVITPVIEEKQACPFLPKYSCAVSLTHMNPAHDPDSELSFTTIVWFQEKNPLTDGFDIIDLAKNIDWKDTAKDGGF